MMLTKIKNAKFRTFIIFYLLLSFSNLAFAEKSWIDFPRDNLREILFKYDYRLDELNSMIQLYHSIKKNDWHTIKLRIVKLQQMSSYSSEIYKNFDDGYISNFLLKTS